MYLWLFYSFVHMGKSFMLVGPHLLTTLFFHNFFLILSLLTLFHLPCSVNPSPLLLQKRFFISFLTHDVCLSSLLCPLTELFLPLSKKQIILTLSYQFRNLKTCNRVSPTLFPWGQIYGCNPVYVSWLPFFSAIFVVQCWIFSSKSYQL